MQIISDEDLARAREMDLLTYLTYHDPGNIRHVSGNVYSTVEHDSLIINNGKWCWFSQGIGGFSALDYLIKVKGVPFRDAVERIIGNISEPLPPVKLPVEPPKVFEMPEVQEYPMRAAQYLIDRGIDAQIIRWCVEHKLIYETTKYDNVLFVGYDRKGVPKYGAVRSFSGTFKGDVKGSDKRFAFRIVKAQSPRKVHVFEAVPDLLSYATLVKLCGKNWRKETYLSLAGIGGSAIPKALEQFLKDYPEVSHIYLHLDNDEPGRKASEQIVAALKSKYVVKDCPPPEGKDYNDYLKIQRSKPKTKKQEAYKR
jgi:hypothetical protein